MGFSDAYWARFNQVASNIGARMAEDLILVLTAETAGTLDPRRTRYSRHPATRPSAWKDVIAWESDHPGQSSGALGLNTIMRPAAQAMRLEAGDWWGIADLGPGDPHALDYTEKFFKYIRAWRGISRPFVDAVELYLANAAPAMLGMKLAPQTVVYSGNDAAVNPGLQGPDGNVRILQMQNALMSIAKREPGMGISAKPFLDDYQAYVSRTGDVYQGPRSNAPEQPAFRPVSYSPDGSYSPFDSDSTEKINAANADSPPHPSQAFARQIVAAQDIPVGRDALIVPGIIIAAWVVAKLFRLR